MMMKCFIIPIVLFLVEVRCFSLLRTTYSSSCKLQGWQRQQPLLTTLKSSASSLDNSNDAAGNANTVSVAASTKFRIDIDPKEAVKVFGRLAEKYILLDASAGKCCYSACSDCEYRLPGGGYRMADQSAARPKWIPNYISRQGSSSDKKHVTKWSTELFGPSSSSLSLDAFVEKIKTMSYAPTLGGPYLAASAAVITDDSAIRTFFDILSEGNDVLTKNKMSVRLKQLADGEEGLTWVMFQRSMGF